MTDPAATAPTYPVTDTRNPCAIADTCTLEPSCAAARDCRQQADPISVFRAELRLAFEPILNHLSQIIVICEKLRDHLTAGGN